jgi:hypothetical protein
VEENHKSLHQEEAVFIIQAIFDDVFEEALGFLVSSEHGGGHGTTMEERHSPPRWHEGYKELVHEVYLTSMAYGGAPVPPRRSTRSSAPPPYTPRYSAYGFIILSEEEEKKLSHLEKRLVANVDFDDQDLNSLGFGTDIYYMFGHLGCVQFSSGVLANTHKEFALEILMTMVPILDEGVASLSFRLEGIQQVVPYEQIRELLGFQKGAPEKVDVLEGMLDGFCNLISRKLTNNEIPSGTPSSKYSTHGCVKGLWGGRGRRR